jgi:acetoin utilization protein AcuB
MDPDTRVRLLMTQPVLSVGLDDPPSEVRRLLAGYAVHHLPVVRDGKLAGMLTDADLKKLDAFLPRQGAASNEFLNSHISIAKLMSQPRVTVDPEDHIGPVAEQMVRAGVHAAPVVDSHGQLLGILTTSDIIAAALQQTPSSERAPPADQTAIPTRSAETIHALEAVLQAADRFLQSGHAETAHALLLKAVEHAKQVIGEPPGARSSMRSL